MVCVISKRYSGVALIDKLLDEYISGAATSHRRRLLAVAHPGRTSSRCIAAMVSSASGYVRTCSRPRGLL
jgi:hypothetical protein